MELPAAARSTAEQNDSLERLGEAIDTHDAASIAASVEQIPPRELAFIVAHLSDPQRRELLEKLESERAAELVECLPLVQAIQLIEEVGPQTAASLIEELPSDHQADVIGGLDREDAERILSLMDPAEAAAARRLSRYDEDSAGGLMVTEMLRFPETWDVQQVVGDLTENAQRYRDYHVQYAYVCDAAGRLTGVLPMRSLLLAARSQPLRQLMIADPLAVAESTGLEQLHGIFEAHPFLGIPVVDPVGRLVGVVQREDVDEAWFAKSQNQFLASQGIIGEEIRSQPILQRSGKRLSWLSINIFLNLIAASIIAFYEPTLQRVIALAVFLPIISDMSGCSGNQAVAVSIRELMLDLARPQDVWRVWWKEAQVGLLNGLVLGVMLGCIAWFWKTSPMLGVVVGLSLWANTLVAVCIGGMVPLILRAAGRDPAVASGPLLTTITDMCGFFLVLSLASWLLV